MYSLQHAPARKPDSKGVTHNIFRVVCLQRPYSDCALPVPSVTDQTASGGCVVVQRYPFAAVSQI
eukprot:1153361-Prymnesium_polylepis.1